MRWKHNKNTDKEQMQNYKDLLFKDFTRVKTCCECELYVHMIQQFNYEYMLQCSFKKICDLHKQEALDKYITNVRNKLK